MPHQKPRQKKSPSPQGALASLPDSDDAEMFELAPIALWLEDYSGLKQHFDQLRAAGITDLRQYLTGYPDRVAQCSQLICVIKVNRQTLNLYEANDLADLNANLGKILRDDMLTAHIEELGQLWDGHTSFSSNTVNYTISGRRLDIQLRASILPGHEDNWTRVLVAIENVSEREQARRKLALSDAYARGLFEYSPVSLWVEDFGAVKRLLDGARQQGISDFRVFTDVHPEFIDRCMQEIRVIDVNRATLDLFGAADKQTLLRRLGDIFRDDMRPHFNEQLVDLWQGKLFQQREVVNYALDGTALHVYLQFSVLPGYEHNWELVLVALTDITARKKAEAYLEFLGKHDVLTKLNNRSFYVDEMNRLERKGPFPVSVIMADINNLKAVNDQLGHTAGDGLLRRAGEVLAEAVDKPGQSARIGGDEFAILLPATDERGALTVIDRIRKLIEVNNQFYPGVALSLSLGAGTCQHGERLEAVVQHADMQMYQDKRAHYSAVAMQERRNQTTE